MTPIEIAAAILLILAALLGVSLFFDGDDYE